MRTTASHRPALGRRTPRRHDPRRRAVVAARALGRGATARRVALALALAAFLAPPIATADAPRYTVELRADVTDATERVGGRAFDPGLGVEARLARALNAWTALYVGLGRRELPSAGDGDDTLEHSGVALGAELLWSTSGARVGFRLAAGVTRDRLERVAAGRRASRSRGQGWEAGAAVLVPLAGGWSLSPGLRYRSVSDALPADGDDDALALIMLEVGALWSF